MAAGVAVVFCITQMTFVAVDYTLLVRQGWLCLTNLEPVANFRTDVKRLKAGPDFSTEVVQLPPQDSIN